MSDPKTHFGYQEVDTEEKTRRVAEVFHSVANRYDLMNDLMSAGIHRLWKRFAIEMTAARPGHRFLDLAGGTGDLARLLLPRVGPTGQVVLADINSSMLQVGRDRLVDRGFAEGVEYVQADAEHLPFPDDYFDGVTMAFGLRNVTRKDAALASIFRVLRPGGRLLVLEFSKPRHDWLQKLYDTYSFAVLPRLGEWVTHDGDSYRYLAESIRVHPDQDTLQGMLEAAGFQRCEYYNLTGGIVALHKGIKP